MELCTISYQYILSIKTFDIHEVGCLLQDFRPNTAMRRLHLCIYSRYNQHILRFTAVSPKLTQTTYYGITTPKQYAHAVPMHEILHRYAMEIALGSYEVRRNTWTAFASKRSLVISKMPNSCSIERQQLMRNLTLSQAVATLLAMHLSDRVMQGRVCQTA